ncbi:hypothetical protein B0T25DRAFT_558092 [Lasiosphaeria hispida]|uniref:Secreted protein n=1 Tax=Lasiosphaeria hispida TaxID=260671 RepID=A0AAJ0H651_9PEZI|nr:hypothetical protein B0T25DRAFT_558092 [Lasiosphaeria hispida]
MFLMAHVFILPFLLPQFDPDSIAIVRFQDRRKPTMKPILGYSCQARVARAAGCARNTNLRITQLDSQRETSR